MEWHWTYPSNDFVSVEMGEPVKLLLRDGREVSPCWSGLHKWGALKWGLGHDRVGDGGHALQGREGEVHVSRICARGKQTRGRSSLAHGRALSARAAGRPWGFHVRTFRRIGWFGLVSLVCLSSQSSPVLLLRLKSCRQGILVEPVKLLLVHVHGTLKISWLLSLLKQAPSSQPRKQSGQTWQIGLLLAVSRLEACPLLALH